ncbi:AIPR family protein [Diaphorobacter caeni]|uniref:AIPR family protein n=1 Tax=Diaphorobacter caeni TaxID=2784387 RepID=UPI00188F2C8C|nr:AIPR family protein [Diaphorobacter caeni]MBF5005686.1 AIPR family protein [Diaphorobacter caeni]
MTLEEFLLETRAEVQARMQAGQLYEEMIFTDIVMSHMAEIGMTEEPTACRYEGRVGTATLRLSGYAITDEDDQLDLFVSLHAGVDSPTQIPDSETTTAAKQALRFLTLCAERKVASKLDPSSPIHALASRLEKIYVNLEDIRIYVITDRVSKSKSFKSQEVSGKAVRLEVMDIERLFRHMSEGKPRDELVVNFQDLSGTSLPCVYVPGEDCDYDYALTAIPGDALRHLYEKYGSRLLEANVRSFLSVASSKSVNGGIQSTLRTAPERFMAYNNGLVLIVDKLALAKNEDGSIGIATLQGMQIVNGGQTTASLYFTKRKYPQTDLSRVRIPAKIIVMRTNDPVAEEALISDVSRFANSQNSVKQSDLSANKPFHVEMEKLSRTIYCPNGTNQWFYERSAGSYKTLLTREGHTPTRLKQLKEAIPASRRITKTDMGKYVNAWNGLPNFVSLGAQKNFTKFMESMAAADPSLAPALPTVNDFKSMVAKAIIYKASEKLIRPMFPAFQANITAYTISVLAARLGNRIDLSRVWTSQNISPELLQQIESWSREVDEQLKKTSAGRMISEWAKRPECRDAVMEMPLSSPRLDIPEVSA